jgi:hypothetical protein
LYNNGNRAVTIEGLNFGDANMVAGPLTYDASGPPQQVAPRAQRRPLDHTSVAAHGSLTVVVSLRYLCDPPGHHGSTTTIEDAPVTYEFWGEHHSVMLALPQSLVTTGGGVCGIPR